MKYYKLYHNKNRHELKLILMKETDVLYKHALKSCEDSRLFNYNNNYILSSNRTNLKEYAINLKNQWIIEQKEILNKLEEIKI